MRKIIMATLALIAAITAHAARADGPQRWARALPMHALVVETADVASQHGPRQLALWVADAKEFNNEDGFDPSDALTCPEMAAGRYYIRGRVRVSLVDSRRSRIRHSVSVTGETLEIPTQTGRTLYDPREWQAWQEHPLRVLLISDLDDYDMSDLGFGSGPFDVTEQTYAPYRAQSLLYVSTPALYDALTGGGAVMYLRDLNHDGLPNEFALYESESCSDLYAAIIGYSARRDRLIRYTFHLRVNDEGKVSIDDERWIPFAFLAVKPRNGVWRFTVQYPEERPRKYHYAIRYDAARERFVGTENIVSYTEPEP